MAEAWIVGELLDGYVRYANGAPNRVTTGEELSFAGTRFIGAQYWYRYFVKFDLSEILGPVSEATFYTFYYTRNSGGTAPQVCQCKHITKDDADWFPRAVLDLADWGTTIETIDDSLITSADPTGSYYNADCGDEVEADRAAGKDWFAVMLKGDIEDDDTTNFMRYCVRTAATTSEGTRPDGNPGTLVPMLHVVFATKYEKEITEGIAMGEVVIKNPILVYSEGIAAGEVVTKMITMVYSDGLAVGEVVIKGLDRVITEGIAIGEAVSKLTSKIFTEGIAIGEAIIKIRVLRAIRSLTPERVLDAVRNLLKERQL